MDEPATRWHVPTPDGGVIAAWTEGSGPAVVLVHGSMCDHTTFGRLVGALRDHVTTVVVDRRGFGASPDGPGYSAEREFDDIAAVVDAAAERAGAPVSIFGHSWGASCAMGAATRTANVHRLVLYEPSLGLRYPPGSIDRVDELVAAGDPAGAIVSVLIAIAGLSEQDAASLHAAPSWPARLATAPTIAREARIEQGWVLEAGQFAAVTAPTLLLTGSESPPELAEVVRNSAAVLSDAPVQVLQGHGHFAYRSHPEVVADAIVRFVSSSGSEPGEGRHA